VSDEQLENQIDKIQEACAGKDDDDISGEYIDLFDLVKH
jgi:hypothetical protein